MTTAHEPRGGPGTHLSAEDLSALAEGAQPSTPGADEHLLACAACRGEVDAMSELLAQFEEWDAPAMPREVAIRIDAALARESAARAATAGHPAAAASGRDASTSSETAPAGSITGTTPAGPGSSGTTPRPRRRRWRPAPGLSWAVAALVLVAGGLGLIVKLSSSAGQSSSNSASSGSAATQPLESRRSPVMSGPNADAQAGPASPSAFPPGSQLAVWTTQTLSGHKMGAMIDPSCLSDPAFAGSHELATASGTYDGHNAVLIVYANPKNPATVLAVVYASPCTGANFHVLDTGLVAKPPVANTP